MISNASELNAFIDAILKKEGYQPCKDTWYLHNQNYIVLFSLGKSDISIVFENVMGCMIVDLLENPEKYPKYYKSNAEYSLWRFVGKELVRRVFDLTSN